MCYNCEHVGLFTHTYFSPNAFGGGEKMVIIQITQKGPITKLYILCSWFEQRSYILSVIHLICYILSNGCVAFTTSCPVTHHLAHHRKSQAMWSAAWDLKSVGAEMAHKMDSSPARAGPVGRCVKQKYRSSTHSQGLMDGLLALREEGILFDVVLLVEGKPVEAHRILLAASCDYFRSAGYSFWPTYKTTPRAKKTPPGFHLYRKKVLHVNTSLSSFLSSKNHITKIIY